MTKKDLDNYALKTALEHVSCPISASCYEAYELLDECERWFELGVDEFLPDFAQPRARETWNKVTALLDKVLERKKKKNKGGRPKKAKSAECRRALGEE